MVPAGLERNDAAPDVVSAEPEGRMLGWIVLVALLALAAFPKSLGWIRVRLFEVTDHALHNATPTRVIFWAVALVTVVSFAQLLSAEFAWLAALDMATFVELSAAVAIAGAVARVDLVRRSAVVMVVRASRFLRRRVGRSRGVRRAVRMQRPRKLPPPEDWAAAWA